MTHSDTIPEYVPSKLVFYFDIYNDSRVTEDLQGSYTEALKEAPDIFYSPANDGHWIVKNREYISEILLDAEFFSSREATIPRIENPPYLIPFNVDPPDNVLYRRALMPWFSPKGVRQLESKIRHWAIHFIEQVENSGDCDFIVDVSSQFPVSVFMELMGMPYDKLREFRSVADDYFKSVTSEDYEKSGGRIIEIMSELLELRRKDPGDDLVSHLLSIEIKGRLITTEEILAMCHLLFIGGMDTVTNVMGFTYRNLSQDTVLQQRLQGDRSLISDFVEESLRCFGTANSVRIVTQDCERFGIQFREGDMVLNALPISGRGDQRSENADQFDIDRTDKSHLTFGSGHHLCLGNNLARSEMRIFTEEWVKRIPKFSTKPKQKHAFRVGLVHAIESLPLEWKVN